MNFRGLVLAMLALPPQALVIAQTEGSSTAVVPSPAREPDPTPEEWVASQLAGSQGRDFVSQLRDGLSPAPSQGLDLDPKTANLILTWSMSEIMFTDRCDQARAKLAVARAAMNRGDSEIVVDLLGEFVHPLLGGYAGCADQHEPALDLLGRAGLAMIGRNEEKTGAEAVTRSALHPKRSNEQQGDRLMLVGVSRLPSSVFAIAWYAHATRRATAREDYQILLPIQIAAYSNAPKPADRDRLAELCLEHAGEVYDEFDAGILRLFALYQDSDERRSVSRTLAINDEVVKVNAEAGRVSIPRDLPRRVGAMIAMSVYLVERNPAQADLLIRRAVELAKSQGVGSEDLRMFQRFQAAIEAAAGFKSTTPAGTEPMDLSDLSVRFDPQFEQFLDSPTGIPPLKLFMARTPAQPPEGAAKPTEP